MLFCVCVITHTAVPCHVRRVKLKKSSVRTPRVELEEMGPSLDLVMRRSRIASAELFKETRKQPKTQKV